ncbi:hypothetical protein [Streptomyces sp. C36]|uniref:hypothetical protein n=1 Tax=Streptomyces sp. C36 TaxID=3237122 RepID=UPI0034C63F43
MSAVPSSPPLSIIRPSRPYQPSAPAQRARHARKIGLYDSWWTLTGAALALCAVWAGSVWVSLHLQADPALHTVALFVHLASLVLGFGAVLVADYYGLLWIMGRCELRDALGSANRLHLPIWAGLAGLVASGLFLHPNISSTMTCAKLVMVLGLTLNGLQAGLLGKHMARDADGAPSTRLLVWGGATATVSQICWWGAVVIGFINSQH